MEYNALGKTGLEVSAVSFGTSPLGDMFGVADETAAIKSVHDALDAGINFFDSSPYYGAGLAEQRLGRALKGTRDRRSSAPRRAGTGFDEFDFSPERIRDGFHTSLRLLQTDHVDILQLHDIEFVYLDGVFADSYAELVRLRDEGKCRFIGMSGYPLHTMRRAITETELDVVPVGRLLRYLRQRPACRPSGFRLGHRTGARVRRRDRRTRRRCQRFRGRRQDLRQSERRLVRPLRMPTTPMRTVITKSMTY